MAEDWIWTDHIEIRMAERNMARELVEMAVDKPDEIKE